MYSKQINCPSCGASLTLEYRFSEIVVCGFCGQTSYLTGNSFEAKGDKVKLSDYGSKFSVGVTGFVINKKFKVLGRIRYKYPDGFWDEWLLKFEDQPEKEYWLQEDEGDYALFEKSDIMPENTNFEELKVGAKYAFDNKELFISEKNTAQIIGGEGELPYRVIPGEKANFADGIIVGEGIQTSLEFLPNEKQFYIANHSVKLEDFSFTENNTQNGY